MKESFLVSLIFVLFLFSNTSAQENQLDYEQLKTEWSSLPGLVADVGVKTLELKQIYKVTKPLPAQSAEFGVAIKNLRACSVEVDRLRSEVGAFVIKLYFVTNSDKFDTAVGLTEKQWKEVKSWNKKAYRVAAQMNKYNDSEPSVWEISNFILEHGG